MILNIVFLLLSNKFLGLNPGFAIISLIAFELILHVQLVHFSLFLHMQLMILFKVLSINNAKGRICLFIKKWLNSLVLRWGKVMALVELLLKLV